MMSALLAFLAVLLALPPRTVRLGSREMTVGRAPRAASSAPALAALGAAAAVALFAGGSVGLVLGAAAGLVTYGFVRRMEPPAVRRRRESLVADLPHVVDLLASCLAAGQAPGAAIDEVVAVVQPPLREELAAVSARLRLGVDPLAVWRDVAAHPQLGTWGRCMLRAVDSGASVAEAMVRLADDLRRDSRASVEARARAVGVRSALPLGVCLLPAFVLLGVVPLVAGSLSVLSLP